MPWISRNKRANEDSIRKPNFETMLTRQRSFECKLSNVDLKNNFTLVLLLRPLDWETYITYPFHFVGIWTCIHTAVEENVTASRNIPLDYSRIATPHLDDNLRRNYWLEWKRNKQTNKRIHMNFSYKHESIISY